MFSGAWLCTRHASRWSACRVQGRALLALKWRYVLGRFCARHGTSPFSGTKPPSLGRALCTGLPCCSGQTNAESAAGTVALGSRHARRLAPIGRARSLLAALALGSRGALCIGHSTCCVQCRAQPLAQILPSKATRRNAHAKAQVWAFAHGAER